MLSHALILLCHLLPFCLGLDITPDMMDQPENQDNLLDIVNNLKFHYLLTKEYPSALRRLAPRDCQCSTLSVSKRTWEPTMHRRFDLSAAHAITSPHRRYPNFVGKRSDTALVDLAFASEFLTGQHRLQKRDVSSPQTTQNPSSQEHIMNVLGFPNSHEAHLQDTGDDFINSDSFVAKRHSFVGKRDSLYDYDDNYEKRRNMFVGKRDDLMKEDEKRRMFVGKRYLNDYSSEFDPETNYKFEKGRYSKRPRFVGKRDFSSEDNADLFNYYGFAKRPRFVGKRFDDEDNLSSLLENDIDKRRMFVGKRSIDQYTNEKRPKFVGRRSGFDGANVQDSISFEKRPKFVGKRVQNEGRQFLGKQLDQSGIEGDIENSVDKRRMFVGKREQEDSFPVQEDPTKRRMFVGKRSDKRRMFVGKRDHEVADMDLFRSETFQDDQRNEINDRDLKLAFNSDSIVKTSKEKIEQVENRYSAK